MMRKNREGFQIFGAGVEPLETDMSLSNDTTGESKGATRVCKTVYWETQREKCELNTSHDDVKTDENYEPNFGVGAEKRFHM